MVDAPRPEAALRDLEAASFAQQMILRRHAHVSKVISACPCGAWS